MGVNDVIARLDAEREAIWMQVPDEVVAVGNGEIPRRTGSHGQYLSTLIFAEGEARTLSDEMLWGLWLISQEPGADLNTLRLVVEQIVAYKADFFDFVGLPRAAGFIHEYVAAVGECADLDEFARLTAACLSYANRVHMWIDFVFPWGVCDGFKRPEHRGAAAVRA